MRVGRFVHEGAVRFGCVASDGAVRDVVERDEVQRAATDRPDARGAGAEVFGSTAALLGGDPILDPRVLDNPGPIVPVERWLAPVEAVNIFGIGRNYAAHASELGNSVPDAPLVFIKPTSSVCDPGTAVVLPEAAPECVDFEAELAIIIGRTARNVSRGAALEHVFGYTIANDITARDLQKTDKQWSRAKGFDTFCPLGPWITLREACAEPNQLRVQLSLNDEVMQDDSTALMVRNCPELIAWLSAQFTLLPKTVILTGTPAGVGAGRTPPRYLGAGDRVSISIERIGMLSHGVVRQTRVHQS